MRDPAQAIMVSTSIGFTRSGLIQSGDVLMLITEPLLGKKVKTKTTLPTALKKKKGSVHQIKLLHTLLSKSIIWEMSEMERQESKQICL